MAEPRPAQTKTTRLERLRLAARTLRRQKPKAYGRWIARTGLTEEDDGKVLRTVMRLSAEVSHLREAPDE